MPICIYVIILYQQYLRGSNWLLTTVVAKGFPLVTPSDRLHMETEIHGHSAIETLDTRAMGVSCACHVNVSVLWHTLFLLWVLTHVQTMVTKKTFPIGDLVTFVKTLLLEPSFR